MVNLQKEQFYPSDYHCDCRFCMKYMGRLIKPDGSYYNKFERNKYYDKQAEKAHIAKTPLHVAKWAIQEYSAEGDWVLDPTMGAGTTAVEALLQKRNVAGVELQFFDVIAANVSINNPHGCKTDLHSGDARELLSFVGSKKRFQLIVNNPPYSGDEQEGGIGKNKVMRTYDRDLPANLAFLKENQDYWNTIRDIYGKSISVLKKNGHFVIGVKDMVKNKKPFLLHFFYGEILEELGLTFQGMALLPHYPPTLFMSTYNKRFPEVPVPRYQTILIFKKET